VPLALSGSSRYGFMVIGFSSRLIGLDRPILLLSTLFGWPVGNGLVALLF
jgi:hypothetical protein